MVKQRLKLASVPPVLLEVYAADGLTLDQLMAFTVSGDHTRQEQVFESLKTSYDKQPYAIRRMLTEGAVRACDKRAQFIGLEAIADAPTPESDQDEGLRQALGDRLARRPTRCRRTRRASQ